MGSNPVRGKLRTINEGIEKDGAFYLFTLRLVPIFPFFVINLLMGLTNMPLRTFYWVSQLGMLAGTAVYINAGKELAKVDSLSGIMSPSLLASFAILGLFPITVKKSSIKYDWPFMMFASLLFYVFILNGYLQFVEGLVFFLLLCAYIIFSIYYSRKYYNHLETVEFTATNTAPVPKENNKP